MSILQEINTDLKQAMREQDVLTRDTLRMLVAEIKRYEIDNKTSANEEDILKIIKKMLKQRKDSIEQFTAGNRQDLACLLYTSPSPRDGLLSRMPSSA